MHNFVKEDLHDGKLTFGPPFNIFELIFKAIVVDNDLIFLKVLAARSVLRGL